MNLQQTKRKLEKEYNEFETEWNKRRQEFESHAKETMSLCKQEQQKEFQQYKMDSKARLFSQTIKFSVAVLEEQSREIALARNNKYTEAYQAQQRRKQLENKERKEHRDNLTLQWQQLLHQKQKQHRNQFHNLKVLLSYKHTPTHTNAYIRTKYIFHQNAYDFNKVHSAFLARKIGLFRNTNTFLLCYFF